ncbi:ATP-dependent Clp protease ATP-binding subunit [Anaeromyxobacter sp. Fw109-5]|uniref:ATP-dependent Clp protease ATP-binding subunit n=1 Tax=Anaeromyxobacter sp. (strain Fw109-5) TaxID=404589 RepID=UPI0000ED8A54|nr:ATP-dependent Clp protease ATP-binding subunit [Anaeromyxobacter sp. Fw109-5]ABS27505.1 ATPase AAA-2 domain protein [Anaeromyxobacter sp. Fw109-5]
MAERDAGALCDICHRRPAAVRVTVSENGRRRTMNVCEQDYARLQAQNATPFESLFGGGLFGDDLMGGLFGEEGLAPRGVGRQRRRRDRESVDITEFLSAQGEEILQQAARAAVDRGARDVDSEHLLFALADNDVVQAILSRFKLSPEDLKRQLDEISPRREAKEGRREQVGVSPRVKGALEHAFHVSRDLGHSYVGPEHLLIGLAEEEGIAGDLLRRYGLTPQALRQQTVHVVGKGAEEGRLEEKSDTPNLDKYSRDITRLAREGKLDPVIGRASEIETVTEVLARRKKNNPVLIGEPGVGKTAIVEGLAQRIVHGEVPDALRDKRLVELMVNSLVAGTQYRGQFEERVKQVLDEVTAQQEKIILFIDELHTIVGAGAAGGEGGLDVANTFKPQLARGELHLIGATTLNEYQKHIEKDAALERRFQPVIVPEPTVEQTVQILRGLRDRFEAHHKVTISDEAITAAAELSDRYISNRFLPDKAIDLIDQAAARVRLRLTSRTPELQEAETELQQLRREREYATSRKDFERAKGLEERLDERQKEYDANLAEWNKARGSGSAEVRVEHVAEIISKLTGIPVTELTTEERERLLQMEERLHQRVIGQDEAVHAVSEAVRLARAGLKDRRRPVATFFFLGPTGVGKTELARALAELVFGDEDAMVRIDMSEYMERHTVARLIGAPPGYVGYEEGGQLTERVRRKPYSVILLDEFEKAHLDVQNVLLQVLEDGRLTDGKGRVVDFANAIIIATSNIGSDLIQENLRAAPAQQKDYAQLKNELLNVLRRHLRPEFLNRIDEIIVFHALDREQIRQIVGLQLERVKRTAHGQGLTLEFDDSIVEHLAEIGYQPEYGARELRRQIRSLVETELASAMLRGGVTSGDTVRFFYDKDADKVRWEKRPSAAAAAAPSADRKRRAAKEAGEPAAGRSERHGAPGRHR